ncbi:MAG: hypothetical protein IMZ71_02390, partial [Chloroflexi bacterium]|nr:hypothetical protein [Chloroflexota bacterium]
VLVRVPVSTECDITFPEITHHDIMAETGALLIQSNAEWISKRTARAKLGLDNEKEEKNLREETEGTDTRTGEDTKGDEELLKSRAAQEEMNTGLDQAAQQK